MERRLRICVDWCKSEGLDDCGALCRGLDGRVLEAIVSIFNEEALEVLGRLEDDIAGLLGSLEAAGRPELLEHLEQILDELRQIIGEPEFPSALAAVLDDPELAERVAELSGYEVFLEEVARRLEAARSALRSIREQLVESGGR